MWIRNPFLKKGARLHKWTDRLKKVVHGHTITGDKLPTNHTDRVNLDTGAFMTGVLSAYNVTKNTFNQIKGEPNAAYGAN